LGLQKKVLQFFLLSKKRMAKFTRAHQAIEQIASLSQGWCDGEGEAIPQSVLSVTRTLLQLFSTEEIQNPTVAPDVDNAIHLEWHKNGVSLFVTVWDEEDDMMWQVMNSQKGIVYEQYVSKSAPDMKTQVHNISREYANVLRSYSTTKEFKTITDVFRHYQPLQGINDIRYWRKRFIFFTDEIHDPIPDVLQVNRKMYHTDIRVQSEADAFLKNKMAVVHTAPITPPESPESPAPAQVVRPGDFVPDRSERSGPVLNKMPWTGHVVLSSSPYVLPPRLPYVLGGTIGATHSRMR
jgi:hypothetical protein